jgi:hypothetical protein
MNDLILKLELAMSELHAVDATMTRRWRALWLTLGRAMQAASAGDLTECRRWLLAAGEHECNLTSRCNVLGPLIESLRTHDEWEEETPVAALPPTGYSSRPPASSAVSTYRLRAKRG